MLFKAGKDNETMTYRLICSLNIIPEKDFHIIDMEHGFVCKYEIRDTRVRQKS